jgi:hypothetical protein
LLTVEMMEGCRRDNSDVAILFAADEDYVPLVEAVKGDERRVVHAFLDVPHFGRRLRLKVRPHPNDPAACAAWSQIAGNVG